MRYRTVARPVGVGMASGIAVATTLVATLAAEVLWVARRRLPVMSHVDASGSCDPTGGAVSMAPVRVVALGDSTLTGPGLPSGDHVWIRTALTALGHPVEVTSLAVGGSRVADVAARVDEAIELRPDVVVISVGVNDVTHGTSARQFRAALDGVVGHLVTAVPAVAVANIGDLGNIARVPHPLSAVLRWRSRVFCSIIESVVAAHEPVVVLDVTSSDHVFRDRSIFAADLFHPAEPGHAAWAGAVMPGLRLAVERALAGSD